MQRSHPLADISAGLCDRGYGCALALLRVLHVLWDAQTTRRVLRIGWRTLRVGVLFALLVCAARGAGWL